MTKRRKCPQHRQIAPGDIFFEVSRRGLRAGQRIGDGGCERTCESASWGRGLKTVVVHGLHRKPMGKAAAKSPTLLFSESTKRLPLRVLARPSRRRWSGQGRILRKTKIPPACTRRECTPMGKTMETGPTVTPDKIKPGGQRLPLEPTHQGCSRSADKCEHSRRAFR